MMGGSLPRKRAPSSLAFPGNSIAIDGIVSVGVVPPPRAH